MGTKFTMFRQQVIYWLSICLVTMFGVQFQECAPVLGEPEECNPAFNQFQPYWNGACHTGTTWDPKIKCCTGCPQCGPGWTQAVGCKGPCLPCPMKTFSENTNNNKECHECTKCEDLYRFYEEPCTPARNAQCGKCVNGYAEHPDLVDSPIYEIRCLKLLESKDDHTTNVLQVNTTNIVTAEPVNKDMETQINASLGCRQKRSTDEQEDKMLECQSSEIISPATKDGQQRVTTTTLCVVIIDLVIVITGLTLHTWKTKKIRKTRRQRKGQRSSEVEETTPMQTFQRMETDSHTAETNTPLSKTN